MECDPPRLALLSQGEVCLVWVDNKPLVLGSAYLFGRAAIDTLAIDIESLDGEHRMFKLVSPNFRMVGWTHTHRRVHGAFLGGTPALCVGPTFVAFVWGWDTNFERGLVFWSH